MPETFIPGPAGHCFDRSLLNQPSEKNHMRIGNFSAWMQEVAETCTCYHLYKAVTSNV